MYRIIGLKFAGIQFRARNIHSKAVRRSTASDVRSTKLSKDAKERAVFVEIIFQLRAKGHDSDRIAAEFNQRAIPIPSGDPWSGAAVDRIAGRIGRR
jgi:hypothetical protein